MKILWPLSLILCWLNSLGRAMAQDQNFHIYLCVGQSNMERFPGIEEQDKGSVDERLKLLAEVDFPKSDRKTEI